MQLDEEALKGRFETAVSGVSPDVTALMDRGMHRGEQLRRRRRAEVFGAAGLSAAAAAAIVYSGFSFDLFDSNSTGPTGTTSNTVERINQPANARSLAAAALQHVPGDKLIAAGTMGNAAHRSSIYASVGLGTSRGKVQLDLLATTRVKRWDQQPNCPRSSSGSKVVQCQVSTSGGKRQVIVTAEKYRAGPGPTMYLVTVGARRDSQVVAVFEYVGAGAFPQDEQQPVATWHLPVSVQTMREIVADPRFGMWTTAEMIAKGRALKHFDNSGGSTVVGSRGSSSATVPPAASVAATPETVSAPGSGQSSSGAASAPAPTRRPATAGSIGSASAPTRTEPPSR
jgi:hypothetical protein